jgi:elongation factor Ts
LAITAEQVRDLRERTGAGMMDCKRALEEAGGDLERAVVTLREKGLAAAAKKAGRLASEGLVSAHITPDHRQGALVEVNCETDFVAKNAEFMAFTHELAGRVAREEALGQTVQAEGGALGELKIESGEIVGTVLTSLVAKIGENMTIRRFARFTAPAGQGLVESYIHLGGKIGILIELGCTKAESVTNQAVLALAKDLAMQVAASRPEYVRREDVPQEALEREKAIYKVQAMNEGKPEQVAEKIVLGRVEKYYKDVCLVDQPFIKDPNQSCNQVIKVVAAPLGETITVKRFARFERGEGLAKRADDLAAEVQAQLKR